MFLFNIFPNILLNIKKLMENIFLISILRKLDKYYPWFNLNSL